MMKSFVAMLSQRRSRLARRRRRSRMVFTKSNSSSSETTHDTSMMMDTSTTTDNDESVVPIWKAENFVFKQGTLQESDWWESDSQTEEEGLELSFSVDSRERRMEKDAPWNDSSSTSSSAVLVSSSEAEDTIHHRHCKHFRNRGYETWVAARQAWIEQGRDDAVAVQESSSRRPPVPDKFKKELVKCLADKRQFELSRPIPLSEIIHAYNQAWNIESDDNE